MICLDNNNNNNISDIYPLTSVTCLGLRFNDISDISALKYHMPLNTLSKIQFTIQVLQKQTYTNTFR